MNWVGGSRSRIILKQERRKQKEFFEKKKLKSKMKLLGVSSPKSSAVSLDLLNLYVVNQISIKKDNTENTRKPVHIDITENVKVPVKRHNIELPMSPPRTQYMSNLDDIQNRLQQQVLDSRRQHLSEKVKCRNVILTKLFFFSYPSASISPTTPRMDYMNSARKNPVIMTSNESEDSEGIKELLFDVVKETAELKAPEDGSDCSFLALFEDVSKPIQNIPSTEHFNPFVNQSSSAIFTIDTNDGNQMTNRNYHYDTREAYCAINAKNNSVDRHLEGVFTAPEQLLFKSNDVSSATYEQTSGHHKTHLQDCYEGQHYFIPSENKEKPANLEKNHVESSLSSQSPSYSPRQTESCFSSSPDTSEEEDTSKKKEYLNEKSLKITDDNLVSASARTETIKISHTRTLPLQPCNILTREAAAHIQEKGSILCATEGENENYSAPSEGSSSHQALKREHITGSTRCDGWSQTESSVSEVEKVDVATQCGSVQLCSCGSSLPSARSPGQVPPPGTSSTAGGQGMPAAEAQQCPAGTGSAAGPALPPPEAEYMSLAGRTLQVLSYIDKMKERDKK
ncbi:regulator of DNA class I crossover intermediates 1 [Phaethornis superciliosus]